jgi:hypothetical protein
VGDLSLNGTPRTRIVNHNWKTIRNAMHVAKNEHMSSVDDYVSPLISYQGVADKIARTRDPTFTRYATEETRYKASQCQTCPP